LRSLLKTAGSSMLLHSFDRVLVGLVAQSLAAYAAAVSMWHRLPSLLSTVALRLRQLCAAGVLRALHDLPHRLTPLFWLQIQH
jgi:hypothetical protein